jgi:hypothetical protein
MGHNDVIPNVHLKKHWQLRVKTWFDQPGRKKRRRIHRAKKAADMHPKYILINIVRLIGLDQLSTDKRTDITERSDSEEASL